MTRRRNGADHPAERGADDVGGLDLQVIQQRDRVVGVPIGRSSGGVTGIMSWPRKSQRTTGSSP